MSALWNWLTKKQTEEEMLDEQWSTFDKEYTEFLCKEAEESVEAIKASTFRISLNKFCTTSHISFSFSF